MYPPDSPKRFAPVAHQKCLTDPAFWGSNMRRIRRFLRSVSTFLTNLCGALLKAVVISMALGMVVVSVMKYMGVPVPSASDLIGGISRLAKLS
jgi:hypothetical protein